MANRRAAEAQSPNGKIPFRVVAIMTIGLAWVGRRRDGREHLYIAADSRTRGAYIFDSCPKIMTLPRSDCALCFAGDTADTYPLMLQMAYAIGAHEPSRERSMDIARVNAHLLRLFTDLVRSLKRPAVPFKSDDAQFLFAGYSWLKKDFRIWTIQYSEREKKFISRESINFSKRLKKVAFIGDWATRLRSMVASDLGRSEKVDHVYLEPLQSLCGLLENAKDTDTIGGPPQLIRITQHMNTRPLCVRWRNEDTLLGRGLFDYENTDYWTLDPTTLKFRRPRKFGFRFSEEEKMENADENSED